MLFFKVRSVFRFLTVYTVFCLFFLSVAEARFRLPWRKGPSPSSSLSISIPSSSSIELSPRGGSASSTLMMAESQASTSTHGFTSQRLRPVHSSSSMVDIDLNSSSASTSARSVKSQAPAPPVALEKSTKSRAPTPPEASEKSAKSPAIMQDITSLYRKAAQVLNGDGLSYIEKSRRRHNLQRVGTYTKNAGIGLAAVGGVISVVNAAFPSDHGKENAFVSTTTTTTQSTVPETTTSEIKFRLRDP